MAPIIEGVDRALRTIEALGNAGPDGLALKDLAEILRLDKAVLHRTLATLKHRQFASQDANSGNYRLGDAVLAIADSYLSSEAILPVLHGCAAEICATANELVHVGVPSGNQVRYIDKAEPDLAIQVVSHIGTRNPMTSTALGRAILAIELEDKNQLRQRLPHVEADTDYLWQVIETAREQGFAIENEENEGGISCVAVGIERGGVAVAAVSISAPADRLSPKRQEELAQLIRSTLGRKLPPGLRLQRTTAGN